MNVKYRNAGRNDENQMWPQLGTPVPSCGHIKKIPEILRL